MEYQPNIPLK